MGALALHHFSVLDVDVMTLIDLAAATECTGVCLFVSIPEAASNSEFPPHPFVARGEVSATRRKLSDAGVAVTNVEYFPIDAAPPFDVYREYLSIGSDLGARLAVTHVHDDNLDRAAQNLGRLADLAGEYGMMVGLEFMPLSPACPTIHSAAEHVLAARRGNLRIGIDALHLFRSGGTPEDVASLSPDLIGYFQLCDGLLGTSSDYFAEAFDRKIAGEGEFPLEEVIRALPSHVAFDVETPLATLAKLRVLPLERARKAVAGARATLAAAGME